MRARLVAAFAALAITLTLVACSDDPPKAPTTVAPAGFTVVSDADDGFALAVPSDWTQIPITEDMGVFNADTNRLRLQNPRLASAIVQARELAQNGSGRAVVVRPDGLAKVNLTLDKTKEKTLAEIAEVSKAGLEEVGATDLVITNTTVASRPAARLAFHLAVKMDDGTFVQEEYLYIVQRGSQAFFLTVIGIDEPEADTIAATLRIR